MKGNCDYQPPGTIEYSKTGTGQVLFNIERNDKEVEGKTHENWDFDFCEVPNFKRETIIARVVRSKYTQDEAEAILANYAQRKDVSEYLAFQEWRNLAKSVASGKHLKSELAEHYEKQLIQVKMPLSFVLSGGKYEVLADRVLKLACPYEITKEDGIEYVTTWLVYIEPEHQYIQTDTDLEIRMVNLI
jgi:hypothetical protein